MRDIIITAVVLVALVGGGFWWYSTYSATPVTVSPAPAEGGKTLEMVQRLKAVNIDTTFFSDPQFLELEPAPLLILESFPKGRSNPFDPL